MCAMLLPEVASFAAAMLFAVHPVHTEAVSTYCAYILGGHYMVRTYRSY